MFSLLEKSGLSRYFFAINGKILEILYIFLKKNVIHLYALRTEL